MTHHYEGMLGDRQLGVGAVDVQDPKVESGETVAARIRRPTAGSRRSRPSSPAPAASITCRAHVAFGKLQAMTEAKRILGG